MNNKYDKGGNLIYCRDAAHGEENWWGYDENNRIIYYKNYIGEESWYKYDRYGNKTGIPKEEFEEIKEKNQKYNRFEVMEI